MPTFKSKLKLKDKVKAHNYVADKIHTSKLQRYRNLGLISMAIHIYELVKKELEI